MSVVLNQDGALRGRLAVGRIEPDAETSHVHGAPVGTLLRHRQIQHISVERDGAFHVLDFVVDVLNARDHRTPSEAGGIGLRGIVLTSGRGRRLSKRAPPPTLYSRGASPSSSVPLPPRRGGAPPPSGAPHRSPRRRPYDSRPSPSHPR